MNYLAHLYFASPTAASIAGNLGGDFFKGRIEGEGELAGALRLHRRIDEITDTSPAVGRARRRLAPRFGHYSRIITDVFWDHILAREWTRFSREPFDDFRRRIYGLLPESLLLLPAEARIRFTTMAREDWLGGYAETEGVRMSLQGLSQRIRRGVALDRAVDDLTRDYAPYREDFLELFPSLLAQVGETALARGEMPQRQ